MPRGKTKRVITTTTETAPDEDLREDFTEPTDEEIQDAQAADEFDAAWGTPGNKVRVVKLDGLRPRSIGTYAAELLTLDLLQEDQQEGGYFELTLVGPDGRYIRKKAVDLGPLPASKRKAAAPAGPNPSDPWLQLFIQSMQQNMQHQQTLMLAMLNRSTGESAPREKISDLIQAVVALNGAMKPPNQTELLGEIFEIADKIKAGGETGWSVLKEALPVVMDRLGGLVAPTPAPPPIQPMPVVVAPAETVTTGGPPPVPLKTDYEYLRETLSELKGYARRNKDVTVQVAFAIDRDDERGFQLLLDAIDDFPFEQLIAYDSEISGDPTLRDWFFKFYTGVKDAVHNPVDTGGAGGNPGHAGPNGGSGA
jgi:hypothetical protein